ncbi:hypothetical protein TruAng_003040 [Truncatella angustata]|nr:hypothetical protein TruAng_003040 [Truncatella angustata]
MAQTVPLRIVSFNIRYAATNRGINERPPQVPPVSTGSGTVIGLQEVLNSQLQDIDRGLGNDWAYIGVGRDDGRTAGEYNPIFYQPSKMRLVFQQTKWLSPTPDVPSYGWNANSRRIVNVGVFQHVATGRRFIAANTHLDNASSEARTKGVQVVLRVIKDIQSRYGPLPVYLTGDFNSQPGEDAYTTVVNDGYLADMYTSANTVQKYGPYETFTGFDPATVDQIKSRIDFIWLGPKANNRWTILRYEVLNNVKNNVYMSDHRAVVGDVWARY